MTISGDEIRLLDLYPHSGDTQSLLKCSIRVAKLSERPAYEALSYVWGTDGHTFSLEIDDRTFIITDNLHTALCQLRLENTTRTLWIDQLCINQDDKKEKAQQVRLMRQIYSGCRSGILWMGDLRKGVSESDGEAALDIIRYMAAVSISQAPRTIPLPSSTAPDAAFEKTMATLKCLVHSSDGKGNTWWSRIWTVQEAVLPPHVVLQWGPLILPWEELIMATRTWTTYMPSNLRILMRNPCASFMGDLMAMAIWLEVAKSRRDPPLFTVVRWRHREATDPRDKIYGLLGLCPPGSLQIVEQCNYDLSTVEVFTALTMDLIMNRKGLAPLIIDPRLEAGRATPGMPTWAIDLAHMAEYNTNWYHLYGYDYYKAHGNRGLDPNDFKADTRRLPGILELTGMHVDTVEIVGSHIAKLKGDGPPLSTATISSTIEDWGRTSRTHFNSSASMSSEIYVGASTPEQAFRRLLIGDLVRNREQWVERRATAKDTYEVGEFLNGKVDRYIQTTIKGMITNQAFFITKSGLMGLGHMDTQVGDQVWVFHGGAVPFTLRPCQSSPVDGHEFGGRCYVQGIMNGEGFDGVGQNSTERIVQIR